MSPALVACCLNMLSALGLRKTLNKMVQLGMSGFGSDQLGSLTLVSTYLIANIRDDGIIVFEHLDG
jgi:hypothetical protein